MIILPTKGRPENLRRFIHHSYLTGGSLPINVVLDESDKWRYCDIKIPKNWRLVSVPKGTHLGGIFQKVFSKYPDESYYGMVADDVVPQSMNWDIILAEACQPDKIAWGRDGIQNERLPVHPFIGGDLIRKLGWWSAPGLNHWFVDNVWKNLADALGCGVYLQEVKMTHYHHVNGLAYMDKTYTQQPDHDLDQRAYIDFMKNKFPSVIKSFEVTE